jgi:hypothetical protein
MERKRAFFLLLAAALGILGYGLWQFIGTEKKVETEVTHFEAHKLYPVIRLGYARGNYYASETVIKPDLAVYYTSAKDLKVNQVTLEGVWYVERDRITSLSEGSRLTVKVDSEKLSITVAGKSDLPVRYELNGKTVGSFKVNGEAEVDLTGADGIYFPKVVTLYIPRGVSAYILKPHE